ncbi:MAG TPA: tail fiber domain-containing protein, partial [Syntrophobacteraceae bacterium]|nr:tail fiber domain-containing protein [Syntrophobacteraceae bacterium]
ESNTIRIGSNDLNGNPLTNQTFIAGIHGALASGGTEVFVTSDGKLGTLTSSRRYKEEIADMGDASSALMKLRPVIFRYKPEYADGQRTLQYGLIAEEVAEVYPDLVHYDPKTGQPYTVAYHLMNAMLLNEVQKQQRRILEQENRIIALEGQVKEFLAFKEQMSERAAMAAPSKGSSTHLSKLDAQLNK